MQLDQSRWVPVVSSTGKPLMPCHPARARKLVAKGKAISRWRRGIYHIVLTVRSDGDVQPVAIGVDPGSKREGYTVMSAKRTFLNILSHAVDGKSIKKAVEGRANARRARRSRNTPCRQPRFSNRSRKGWVPPSTKARWQLKLNVVLQLSKLYPITQIAIEDVSTELHKGERRRNSNFSPIQAGKNWLYGRLDATGYDVTKFAGMQTYQMRQQLGLTKTKHKLAVVFEAHCVDSWVLANAVTGNRLTPDLKDMLTLKPLAFTRRQLHRFNPTRGGELTRYGGTMSLGIKRGTLVTHHKHGKCLVGGNDGVSCISLHSTLSYTRLCQNAKPSDVTVVAHSPWIVTDHTTFNKDHKHAMRKQRKTAMSHLTRFTTPPPRAEARGIRGDTF